MDQFSKVLLAQNELENAISNIGKSLNMSESDMFYAISIVLTNIEKKCLTRVAFDNFSSRPIVTDSGVETTLKKEINNG